MRMIAKYKRNLYTPEFGTSVSPRRFDDDPMAQMSIALIKFQI